MTFPFEKGKLTARLAASAADVRACQALRHLSFHGGAGEDADPLDPEFQHLMIHDREGVLCGTLRFRLAHRADDLARGYVAQYYDLSGWRGQVGPFLEIGRFCTAPGNMDADLLRMLWGALTRIVDQHGAQMLLGCTSFVGTDPRVYGAAFQRLMRNHQGPPDLIPSITTAQAVRMVDIAPSGIAPVPALLKSYLSLGGWVGDHVVVDPKMNTLHVFTCLPVSAMSAARVARLRAVAS
ncbi:GNAT family N-acetyltransferase [Yoonia sp. I 8.24]|uniref:GNAT family N-acetyltransferase n=1 Tax=Yoonia sp. I 8.24 TaxID=1537229 RepID=UPI001EDF8C86|nr:GNAT family N-acyltransferase [Yoonia sp. I 8.24]MCG3266325.1 GNAT family N-acetyltransferase [Yoonia sp. I 8.24]